MVVEDFILQHLASHVNCQGEEFVICDSSGTLAIFDEVASNVGSQQACGKDESEGPMAVEIFKAMFLCFESKPAAFAHGLAWIFNSTYCKGKGSVACGGPSMAAVSKSHKPQCFGCSKCSTRISCAPSGFQNLFDLEAFNLIRSFQCWVPCSRSGETLT